MKNYRAPDYWKAHGLGTTAAVQAEWLLPAMLAIVHLAPRSVVEAVLREAQFQFDELPLRDEAFRQKYLADALSADVAAIRAFEPIVAALLRNGFDGDELFDCLNEAICNVQEANPDDNEG